MSLVPMSVSSTEKLPPRPSEQQSRDNLKTSKPQQHGESSVQYTSSAHAQASAAGAPWFVSMGYEGFGYQFSGRTGAKNTAGTWVAPGFVPGQ